MTATHTSGPEIIYGQLGSGAFSGTGTGGSNPEAGPSACYQGDGLLDVRYPYAPGITGLGKVRAYLDTPYILMVDSTPQTLGNANIAAAQNTTSGTAMTLIASTTQSKAISPGIKLIPYGAASQQASAQVTVTGIEIGFTKGNTTSGSTAIASVTSTANLYVGMPIVICGGGVSSGPLFTTVASITSATAFVTVDAAGATTSNCSIGTANDALTSPDPYRICGAVRMFDPSQGVARAVSVTGSASATGGNITVLGYDINGVAMTETIAAPASATTVNGKKAFKYIISATPAFSDAHNYSLGTTDIFGFHLRSDQFEYMNIFQNGAFITSSTGYTAAVTSTATATTGDVRGTYAVQSASDGTKRLSVYLSIPLLNLVNATPQSYSSLYGVTQF